MATVAAMWVAGFVGRAGAAGTGELDPWKSAGKDYWIAGPLRLNLEFTDETGTARVAVASSLKPEQLAGLPDGLAQARASDLFQAGHFDALWAAMQSGVCTDVRQEILKLVNHSPNTAYDVTPCALNKKGYLTANFQENWTNESMQSVSGRRIVFNYLAPLNAVAFWVTSPHTCHHGDTCPTEPQDPSFTVIFTADLTVTCTSTTPNAASFVLPVSCTPAATIVVQAVFGGDVTGQVVAAAVQWSKQVIGEAAGVVATGGASLPVAAAAFIAQGVNVAVKGIGAAIAAATDQHLRDQVSAWIAGYIGSPTLAANAHNVSNDLNTLFQNLYFANLGGLRPFAMGVALPDLDLDFGLVYPTPARPVVQNTTAASNKGSLFATSIAVSQPQVVAGQTIPVTCNYFRGAYVNVLNIAWNKTVLGTAKSTLEWGPPKTQISTAALTFDATNLTPATKYGFTVHECDGLSCAPWSEVLWTATEAAGSNIVSFWLDNNTSEIIGKTAIGTNGYSFQANVTIPASTATGTHELHAAVAGSQPVSATISVCQVGGCGAFIGVVNPQNNTFYPAGSLVGVGNPVVVRGSKFAPGGSVWIWVDGVHGTRAAIAPVGPLGNFQAKFNMPQIGAGNHTFLAIELKPGIKLPPIMKGQQPSYPPQDFVFASVAISVSPRIQ